MVKGNARSPAPHTDSCPARAAGPVFACRALSAPTHLAVCEGGRCVQGGVD